MQPFTNAVEPFAGLPDVSDVHDLDDADRACLDDLRAALERHGRQSRFGITLLHSHFPVTADEVLIEECDPITRTLTIQPRVKSTVNADKILETQWRLDCGTTLQGCSQYCTQSGSSHTTGHSGSP
jgi:hypothetical protein